MVQLNLDPPSDYEIIGVLNVSGSGYSEQESQDLAITELKKQAAKLGANGVLLTESGQKAGRAVGRYGEDHEYAVSITAKTVSGRAIRVK